MLRLTYRQWLCNHMVRDAGCYYSGPYLGIGLQVQYTAQAIPRPHLLHEMLYFNATHLKCALLCYSAPLTAAAAATYGNVSDVMSVIRSAAAFWRPERLRPFPELRWEGPREHRTGNRQGLDVPNGYFRALTLEHPVHFLLHTIH
jgi:hypothetical protein